MNGFLLVNKDKNCTSHDVVAKIRRITKCKVGHLGTLDPFATGMLPIAIGKATKFADYFLNQNKCYKFSIKWGEDTDSLDLTGNITKNSSSRPKLANLKVTLEKFKGKITQIPPQFSALKINGKAAYKYARKGEHVEIKARELKIFDLDILSFNEVEAEFLVYCSKGTYVRSLARDICSDLNVCGYVNKLNREYVDLFKNFSSNLSANKIFLNATLADVDRNIIKIDEVVKTKYNYAINHKNFKKLSNGLKLSTNNLPFNDNQDIKIKLGTEFCMVANIKSEYIKSKKLLTN